ncbi:DUF4038 domain-containing protein [Archangium violaceum]|uniref:apiosidase-like domain-containing protein n=1 Tax=Archangium violaceum TaxID=83451 RepID=UPI00193B9DD9|nr:DUF4038 domain-containing protein [Archangium violaceum]QRK12074.1 DUF4038 domain-containing protein [Archangium violaceum]
MNSSRRHWQTPLFALGLVVLGACGPEREELEAEASGGPEAALAANPLTLADYPIKASADQRSLVTATGAPFRYVADTPWGLPSRLSQADVIAYLDDRKAKGFNTIQVMLLPMPSEWGTKNYYGDTPFNDMNPASPAITSVATTNPSDASGYDYWDHVEWVIDQAGQRGIQVAAAVSWYGYGGRDWRPYMTTSASTSYGTFLGKRFGGKNNLFWILGGDNNPTGDAADVPAGMDTSDRVEATNALANAIRANEAKRHLMSYHAKRRSSSAAYFGSQAWHTVHFAYSPETTYSYVLADYNRTTVRPVVMPESYYDARTSSPILDRRRLRAQAWWSYLSGAVGFAYGHENIWDMDSAWKTALQAPSATDIKNLASFLAGYKTHLLRPDHRTGNTQKLLAGGYGTTSTNGGLDYGVSATASDGSFGLAYFPTTRSGIVVNLAALGGGNVTLSWWNPGAGGAKTLIGTYAGTGTRALAWPSGYTDALLVVERAGTPPTSGTLLRAINLGGPALTIDGRSWEASSGAANLTLTGTRFEDQSIPLVPATDANRAQMIRSCIYGTTASVAMGAVPSGTYDVYLYVWEDNATKTFDVRVEGTLVQDNYVSGAPGEWKRLGPWVVSVTDGTLNLTTSGGTANLSGLEVYRH